MKKITKIAGLGGMLGAMLALGGCVSPYYYDRGYYAGAYYGDGYYGRGYSDPYDGYYRPYHGDGGYSDGYGYRRYSGWR